MADREQAPEDDAKRRFREALEAKKARKGGGEAHTDAAGKARGGNGPGAGGGQRMFRRKSG